MGKWVMLGKSRCTLHIKTVSSCSMFARFFSELTNLSQQCYYVWDYSTTPETGSGTWFSEKKKHWGFKDRKKRRWNSAEPAIQGRMSRAKPPDYPVELHVNHWSWTSLAGLSAQTADNTTWNSCTFRPRLHCQTSCCVGSFSVWEQQLSHQLDLFLVKKPGDM